MGFPGISDGKESTCNEGNLGSIPGLGRSPGKGQGNPLQCSCLENPHGQRSLVGYSPWSHNELDMTEGLSTAQNGVVIYNLITIANTAIWYIGKLRKQVLISHDKQKVFFSFFPLYCIFIRWMFAEPIMVITSQYMYIKPSCSVPSTCTVINVNYF